MKIKDWESEWLRLTDWDFVEGINSHLCAQKRALHKATSDGYEPCLDNWMTRHASRMSILKAADLCRESHRLAPFCFFNGNTFTTVIRQVIGPIMSKLAPPEAYLLRSAIGHYVAGTIAAEEFVQVLEELPDIEI